MIRIDMRIEVQYDGYYHAYDDQTYDADCDQDGYFSIRLRPSGVSVVVIKGPQDLGTTMSASSKASSKL